jgi:large subunit ribosomal protein L18
MRHIIDKSRRRMRRKIGIRKRISGTAVRPRMTVFRSNRFTYLQVIDDLKGATLVSASNREKDLMNIKNDAKSIAKLGEIIGNRLKEKKIETIVFDRNGYKYHGLIKELADAVRKTGIVF